MSIIKLSHDQIDREKWNSLLKQTPGARLYSDFDFLKAVSPDFSALIKQEDDNYIMAFPLCVKKKSGIKYLVQPVFTQQLQILNANKMYDDEFIQSLLKELKRYPSVRIVLDANSSKQLKNSRDFKFSVKKTYCLDLAKGQDFEKRYSKNHKRNIKKAAKIDWSIEEHEDFEDLLHQFLEHKGSEIELGKNFRSSFKRLIPFFKAQEGIKVISAVKEEKKIAAALFAGYGDMMTFLLSYSGPIARENGIMHALINHWLLNNHSKYKILDFEGGNIDALARFYSGFGATKTEFLYMERHIFPFGIFMK